MYDIIMFQQTIFVILTRTPLHMRSIRIRLTALVARDSVEIQYGSSV